MMIENDTMSFIAMPTTHFTVKYDGAALANHEMDVALLAPALMAMSSLVREISQIMSHGEYTATLNVKGNIKSGSIEVELVTQAVSLLQQFKDLLVSDNTTALLNFSGLVALIGGVIALIKKFHGNSPTKVEKDGENVTMHFHEHKEVVSHVVYQIYNNYELRSHFYAAIKPLEQDGIDEFSIIDDKKKIVTVAASEVLYFAPNNIVTPLNENTQESILVLESVVFKDKNKWSFDDGGSSIKAMILDDDFLTAVDNGKRFAKGDWLKVLLRKIQVEENGKLKTSYEVVKVIEHIVKEQFNMDI